MPRSYNGGSIRSDQYCVPHCRDQNLSIWGLVEVHGAIETGDRVLGLCTLGAGFPS